MKNEKDYLYNMNSLLCDIYGNVYSLIFDKSDLKSDLSINVSKNIFDIFLFELSQSKNSF